LRKFYKITELGNHQIEEFITGWREIQQVYDFIKECADYDKKTIPK